MAYASLREIQHYNHQFFELYEPEKEEPREHFTDPSKKELCIFLQLHNDQITPELLKNVDEIHHYYPNFDVYITVIKESSIPFVEKEIQSRPWVDAVKRIDMFKQNRGMDIGAFLWQLDQVRKTPHEYVALLKFHTKSMHSWRREMIQPFIKKTIQDHVRHLQQHPEVGLMGVTSRMYLNLEYGEAPYIREMEKAVFGRNSAPGERGFIGGSVFLANYKTLCEMMAEAGLREHIEACYTKAPIGWCADGIPHAFERFISYYMLMKSKKILGVRS